MFKSLRFLSILFFVLLISTLLLGLILWQVDPFEASIWILIAFYLLVFVFTASLFALMGYIGRVYFSRNAPLAEFALISARQGVLLGILLASILFLQSFRAVTLGGVALITLSLIFLEIAFLSR